MKFFSGFCLSGEETLFEGWIDHSDFSVAGFSYGAIKAYEYALACKSRIDRLYLISPAYFMEKDENFKKLQLSLFAKNPMKYRDNFLAQANARNRDIGHFTHLGSQEELAELLNYRWSVEGFDKLRERGVQCEIFIGGEDKIVDPKAVKEFFSDKGTLYFIKAGDHFLSY